MRGCGALIRRNSKLFFKDKAMFFTSLITPVILLVLYATFLAKVYRDSFVSAMPEGFTPDGKLISGTVGAQLASSLLAVSCVTVAFCSNLLMVQDKVSGARKDLVMSPVKSFTLAMSYFISSAAVTLIVSFVALLTCFVYLWVVGWYLSAADAALLCVDVVLLVLFGTALSSLINCNLSTNGQGSAVGTIVSSGYGFICGAYMPIASFGEGLQKVLSFLPGTYATALIRNHAMGGALKEMEKQGVPAEVMQAVRDSVDCNLYFCGEPVSVSTMFLILAGAVAVLIFAYIALCHLKRNTN